MPASLVVALIATGAFGLRVFLTWPSVFGQDYVAFVENDAWYHMRLVDALVRDFPWRIWHDPYLVHPGGEAVNAGPVLDWIIAAAALVLGAGAPSPRLVDVVGAYVPPIMGALTVVPVYVLGRELFSRRAGLWAALMVAVMPGQLLQRSLLGYTDHHCAEVLLSTTALMFVVLALRDPPNPSRHRTYALAAGFGLGTYLLTWGGGVLFVAILVAWGVLQVFLDAFREGESDEVVGVAVPALLIAAMMVTPWARTRPHFAYQLGSLVGGAVVIWALHFSRREAQRREWKGTVWVAFALGVVCVSAALALLVIGDDLASLATDARRVSPFRSRGFIVEAQPLMASVQWRPIPLWTEFTSSLVLAIAGTGMLLGRVWSRQCSSRITLLGCWTATTIFATFGQVRFTYYLAVNVALIGGFACDRVIQAVGAVRASTVNRALATCILACLVIIPGVPILRPIRNASAALNSNWYDALMWMGANTPEPFRDPTRYYRSSPADSAVADYGVLALWDYGYWITRVARRVPVTNPRQTGVRDAADFLLSSSELDANRVIERLGARYVAVDWRLAAPSTISGDTKSTFNGIVRAAGRNPRDYCGLFSEQTTSTATPKTILLYCYPEYFRTMAMRLYRYGGRTATPANVAVVSFRPEIQDRVPINRVTREWSFTSYEEADRFVTRSGRTDVKIVSKHPLETCVPLEALTSYAPVFKSLERDGTEAAAPPVVQLFEYRPPRGPIAAAAPPR